VSHAPRPPFFDSFLRCFTLRFSFRDLPTFLTLCWFGDLSATVTPLVGDVIVGDVQITNRERPPVRSYDFEGQLSHLDPHVNHNRDEHRDTPPNRCPHWELQFLAL